MIASETRDAAALRRRSRDIAAAALALLAAACSGSGDPSQAKTPTVSELLNAANAEYIIGAVPAGMTVFEVGGKAVNYTNELTGSSAQVWVTAEHQIIIAFQGTTGGENIFINPLILVTQVITDLQGFFDSSTAPQAFKDALAFAQQVVSDAQQQGYSPADVFVTGHSLGGWQAEYIAQQTGMGGIGFEAPCLYTTVPGNGADADFAITAVYGDPAGGFGSDIQGEQTWAPPYLAGGGKCPHYGGIVMLGTSSDQSKLVQLGKYWGNANYVGFLADLLALAVEYHFPGVQAYDLGVTLDPSWPIADDVGDRNGPVMNAANDTIPQFIQAAQASGAWVEP